jgi:hypothetical protein
MFPGTRGFTHHTVPRNPRHQRPHFGVVVSEKSYWNKTGLTTMPPGLFKKKQ